MGIRKYYGTKGYVPKITTLPTTLFTEPSVTTTTEMFKDSEMSAASVTEMFQDSSPSIVTEMFQDSEVSAASVTEMFQESSPSIVTEIFQDSEVSAASVTEIFRDSDPSVVTDAFQDTEIQATLSNTDGSTMTSFIDTVTEVYSSTTTEIMKSSTDNYHMENGDSSMESTEWIYVVLGIILGTLVIISLILAIIYIQYRKVKVCENPKGRCMNDLEKSFDSQIQVNQHRTDVK